MSIQEVKLLHRSDGGSLVRSTATLEYVGGHILFLKSPYSLKNEIRAMAGSKWHGFDSENPRKIWSVTDCQRNRFQLAYLMGEDVYAHFDKEVKKHEYTRPLMPHQKELADHFLTYHYGIMAAEMGCVAGESMVRVRLGSCAETLTLSELHAEWRASSQRSPFLAYVMGVKDYSVRYLRIIDVIDQGLKPVVKVTLKSGRSIRVTPDHELCVGLNQFKRADALIPNDSVLAGDQTVDNDRVVGVVPDGVTTVYDIRCEHPHHNFRANGIVVANCGKTLSVQEVMERSGVKDCWWIGPKTSLPNIKREFKIWNLDPTINVTMLNYEALKRVIDEWDSPVPQLVVFDESSRCKGATSQRSEAAQALADMVRDKYGFEGYVIEMSGTPSPKSPLDWHKQCEIAWPGFLKEGSVKALEERLAFLVNHQFDSGVFKKREGWKDDEQKCKHCGQYEHEPTDHRYEPSINEVAYLHDRLKGLVIVKHKKDCLNLPDKRYRRVYCKPNSSTLRAAQALVASAPNTITGLTLLRELSDGFQYRDIPDGKTTCPHCCGKKQVDEWFDDDNAYSAVDMLSQDTIDRLQKRLADCPRCDGKGEVSKTTRVAKHVPCPKDAALRELLDECEETGRIVVFAGFTGSVDHIVELCHKEGWDVVRCDGRGWFVTKHDGTTIIDEEPLDYWANMDHARVAFVAHQATGGMSLTLTESRMAVYWSNTYKPEERIQSEDRIHRIGMDLNKGCVIVDLLHLPSDERVLDVIRENRRLELMTLGEVLDGINWTAT